MNLHSGVLAQRYAHSTKISKNQFRQLSPLELRTLEVASKEDASSMLKIAVSSFIEGIFSAASRRYSWAAIKLYYSMFYSMRAMMLDRGFIVFYLDEKPFVVHSKAGQSVKKGAGNSHSIIFKNFESIFPNSGLIGQEINGYECIDWIENQRNFYFYKCAPFPDPDCPVIFEKFSKKPRLAMMNYLESVETFSYDPEHSIVCLPIAALKEASSFIKLNTDDLFSKHYVDMLTSCEINANLLAEFLVRWPIKPPTHPHAS